LDEFAIAKGHGFGDGAFHKTHYAGDVPDADLDGMLFKAVSGA